jgi:hypothetical protein
VFAVWTPPAFTDGGYPVSGGTGGDQTLTRVKMEEAKQKAKLPAVRSLLSFMPHPCSKC